LDYVGKNKIVITSNLLDPKNGGDL